MAKPIGPICNLDCEYCYYLHKEDLYPGNSKWRMREPTLETFIRQYIEAQPESAPEITFAWQGGEPTLLGVEFFQRIVEIQKRFTPSGVRIVNSLQTNGVLLDDAWCEFLREHQFLVGLSIDGPAELHDRYRYDKKGRPTFQAVHNALKLLKKHGVEFNALVVVNRHNGTSGKRVYTYLRDNGIQFLQFIPIVERLGVGAHPETINDVQTKKSARSECEHESLVSSRSVLPEQYGDFLIEVFQEWVRRDVGRVFVQIFDQALSAWMGHEPSLCIFRRRCGRALAIEHNGDLFSCDHFVEDEYRLGNIHELPIVELANSDRQLAFGNAKETTLPEYCRACEVRFACNGGCPKNRFIETPDGEAGLNYLCAGYRKLFNFMAPYLKRMASELQHGRPAANVMRELNHPHRKPTGLKVETRRTQREQQGDLLKHRRPGRNDFCPCGSGRKFKKCCLQRP